MVSQRLEMSAPREMGMAAWKAAATGFFSIHLFIAEMS